MINRPPSNTGSELTGKDILTFVFYCALALIVASKAIYTKIKRHTQKMGDNKTKLPLPKEKEKPATPVQNNQKKEKTGSQSVSTEIVTTEENTSSYYDYSSDFVEKNPKRNSAERPTKDRRTEEVRKTLKNKSKEKQLKKIAEEQKEKLKKEENDAYKKLRAEKIAEQKKLEAEIIAESKKEKKNNSDKNKQTDTQQKPVAETKSLGREAKIKLLKHTEYLLTFSYPASENSPLTQFIKNLAFLYNFHGYILASRILSKEIDHSLPQSVKLRTLIVHTADSIDLSSENILETQRQMRAFAYNAVKHLLQNFSHMCVDSDKQLQRLEQFSNNEFTFFNIASTPLYAAFNAFDGKIDEHRDARQKVSNTDFYEWMKNHIIPFFNFLLSSINTPQLEGITTNEYIDAASMLIIILGDYCDLDRVLALKKELKRIDHNDAALPMQIKKFVDHCRELRNHLAHNIFDPNEKKINDLHTQAVALNPPPFVIDKMNSDIAIQTILHPGAEIQVQNNNPTVFVPVCATFGS